MQAYTYVNPDTQEVSVVTEATSIREVFAGHRVVFNNNCFRSDPAGVLVAGADIVELSPLTVAGHVLVWDEHSKVLLVERQGWGRTQSLPGGRCAPGEEPVDTARRHLHVTVPTLTLLSCYEDSTHEVHFVYLAHTTQHPYLDINDDDDYSGMVVDSAYMAPVRFWKRVVKGKMQAASYLPGALQALFDYQMSRWGLVEKEEYMHRRRYKLIELKGYEDNPMLPRLDEFYFDLTYMEWCRYYGRLVEISEIKFEVRFRW